jgi:hypothetical protein
MCEHHILRVPDGPVSAAVAQCPEHGQPSAGVEFWAWAAVDDTGPSGGCPCARADRFVVVGESADQRWLASADVVVAHPRRTMCDAREAAARLGGLPGCAFAFVPVVGAGVVLGGRTGLVVIAEQELCAACLYPWLAAGGRLADLNLVRELP